MTVGELSNKSKLSLDVEVEVIKANVKSLGRSFDTFKDHSKESLDGIKESLKEIKNDLTSHVEWEMTEKDKDNKALARSLDKMQEYIDAKNNESRRVSDRAEKKIDDLIKGSAAFLLITLISVLGYIWNAKQNEDQQGMVQMEIVKDK